MLAKAVGATGTVIAIEPEEQSYNHLRENIKLNELVNVRSFPVAIGNYNGEKKLFIGQVTGALSLACNPAGSQKSQVVKVIEGDRLVKEKELPLPRLIKIDVEGYEYAVIQGLHNTLAYSDCKIVCCEIHPQLLPAESKPEDVFNLLRSFGFNRIDIYQRGTTEYHALAQKELV